MKVQELIELLKTCDRDLEVFIYDNDLDHLLVTNLICDTDDDAVYLCTEDDYPDEE